MPIDWKTEVSRVAYWKQLAADHDKIGALPWHLPRNAASPDRIAAAEKIVGFDFPSEFREFLEFADGWKTFFILVDLFGTEDFLIRRPEIVIQRLELRAFLIESELAENQVVIIGASEFDLDVFLLVSAKSDILPGGVVWFASEEVDRYPSFAAFFSAMINYNARIAQKLLQKA